MLLAMRRASSIVSHLSGVGFSARFAGIEVSERLAVGVTYLEAARCLLNGPRWWKAPRGHRGSFTRNLATSAFAASCAAVASLNFFISAGVVRLLPIGSAALFAAYAERSAAMAL